MLKAFTLRACLSTPLAYFIEFILLFRQNNNGPSSEKSNSSSYKSKRTSKMHGLLADPVIGEHAFILWAR